MIKLAIVGGFLGAGKTTVILNLAKKYRELGLKVGIVTNDQGSELVDTEFLKSEGFSVVEVDGGCFCCNFDVFTEKVEDLAELNMPDIILAEPVGSCTDLIATIFKPLLKKEVFLEKYVNHFSYAPLSIVVDPKRVKRVMLEQDTNLFTNEINYLFKKQLEEASVILVNKIDLLNQEEVDKLVDYLKENYKGIDIIPISAKENTGIDYVANMLIDQDMVKVNTLDIDYNTYGIAESYLGWLNATCYVELAEKIDINKVAAYLIDCCKEELGTINSEIAHLKLYAISQSDYLKVSLVSVFDELDFNQCMQENQQTFNLIINARVHIAPEKLKSIIETIMSKMQTEYGATIKDMQIESFAPAQPQPKYRIS